MKRIDKENGHLLIHGNAGSGKTIAASQSVRSAMNLDGCFQEQGIYWFKIGMILFLTQVRLITSDINISDNLFRSLARVATGEHPWF